MAQQSELIAKFFDLHAESSSELMNLLSDAVNPDTLGGSEVVDRRVFLDPRPWPPRSRAAVALQQLRASSKSLAPSAFEFGVVSANHFVESARVLSSLGLEMSNDEIGFQCGSTGHAKFPPGFKFPPGYERQYQLGMLAALAVASADDPAVVQAIGKAKGKLTNDIAGAL